MLHSFTSIAQSNLPYIDFDQSMQINKHQHLLKSENIAYLLNFFKTLYTKNNFLNIKPNASLKIPKLIHQIWLGGKLPAEYHDFRASWIYHHPNWQFIFWTDSTLNYDQGAVVDSFATLEKALKNNVKFIVVDIKSILFDNRIFFDKATNYGESSDILKWEIVYRFGGLYVDTDYECLKPLDQLHYMYDFYTGIVPLDTNFSQLGAALYGATPGHPIMQQCVLGIKDNQHIAQIVIKTGPIHFTKSFCKAAMDQQHQINIALPASYFYPCGYEQRGQPQQIWHKPEAFAVHHWAGSWLKPSGFLHKNRAS